MAIPNFFIVGAAKSGTTSLFNFLQNHSEVFLHEEKELRLLFDPRFDDDPQWYAWQFPADEQYLAVGEASNGYTKYPLHEGAPERIARVAPDARILYVVREPFARMESHWRHRCIIGKEWRAAEEAIREDPIYTLTSLYGEQMNRYYDLFPAENIKVLEAAALFSDPASFLDEVCDFLGVTKRGLEGYEIGNVSAERALPPRALTEMRRHGLTNKLGQKLIRGYRRSFLAKGARTGGDLEFALSDGLRRELQSRFAGDLATLHKLTGRNFPSLTIELKPAARLPVDA